MDKGSEQVSDNAIVFRVDADDAAAQKKLDQLRKDIEKTARSMDKTNTEHNGIVNALEAARAKAQETSAEIERLQAQIDRNKNPGGTKTAMVDPTAYLQGLGKNDELIAKQAELQKQLAEEEKIVSRLETKEENIRGTLEQQTATLAQQKEEAGGLERVVSQQSASGMDQLKASVEGATAAIGKGFKNILKWGFGIRSVFILFRKLRSYIKEAVTAFAQGDKETQTNINNLKSALATLKASWGAAFAPILNAVAPLLQKLISWLTAAANAVAMLMAALGGKGTYKKAVTNNEKLAGSFGAAGDAAEKAEGQIMGFDEINKLAAQDSGGGGGGGGGAGMEYEDANVTPFASKIAANINDVLFNWDDLNPEQIVKKLVAGLTTFLGGVAGFMIGGVPGAIVGTLLGFALGIMIDSVIFDDDGQVSPEEVMRLLMIAVGGLLGGILGFVIGGPVGGLIGASLGMALTLKIMKFDMDGGDLKGKIGGFIEKIKGYFREYIQKWEAYGSEETNGIGFNLVMGILDGMLSAMFKVFVWIGQHVVKPIVDYVKKLFGISSPSTVFAEIGSDLVAGLLKGFQDKWGTFWTWLTGKWDSLRSWWSNRSLPQWHITLPHIQVSWESAGSLAQFFGISSIPHLSISWYAKGGVFNRPSVIGVGENGREAVMPLDRNTGWIKELAEKIVEASYTLGGARPAVAGGLVPPGAVTPSGGGLSSADIAGIVSAIQGMLGTQQNFGQHVAIFEVNGREFARATYDDQKAVAREHGISLVANA